MDNQSRLSTIRALKPGQWTVGSGGRSGSDAKPIFAARAKARYAKKSGGRFEKYKSAAG